MGKEKNESTIKRAFARLQERKDTIIREGMINLAKAGLEYLVAVHNMHEMFMAHTTETDTLAYAVAHDGLIVASGCHNGGDDDLPGSATDAAISILSGTSGWVAVILSEMEGYYRVDYEQDFLFDVSFHTVAEFQTYFKKIDR